MRAKLWTPLVLLALLAGQAQAVTVLKTVAQENAAPKFLQTPSGPAGFCVDALRAIERVSGTLRFVGEDRAEPTSRIENRLAAGDLDVACGLARNDDRLAKARFLEPALFQSKYVVAVRADDNVDVSSLDDIRKLGTEGVIVGVRGLSVMANLAREGGLIVDDASITPEANLKKLLLGRGRFFLFRSPGMNAVIRDAGMEGKVRVLPAVIYTTRLYMLVARTVPRDVVEQLERAIADLERRGELARIYAKWRELDR
jgi:ABC-type amino acid transport substrate-binding protein